MLSNRKPLTYARVSDKGTQKDSNLRNKIKGQAKVLRTCNRVAFVLHLVSFCAALTLAIIFSSNSLRTELTTDFRIYDDAATGPPQAGPFSSKISSLGFYQLVWLELPFPLITAIFHGIIGFSKRVNQRYSRDALHEEKNWLRWLEYGITASFMTWVIMQTSGITNILVLIFVGVIGNICLQWQGYLMEELNTPSELESRGGKVDWNPTIVGWILFVGQWAVIMTYFFSSVFSPRPPSAQGVPIFVYFIVIGLFFQFSAFGLIQFFHYKRWPKFLATGYGTELAFVSLSFVSKFFLDWTLLIGIITNQASS